MDGVICLIVMVMSPVNNRKWTGFIIEDLFVVKSGVRLTKKNMKVGNLPFIGSTDRNNGVTNFVSNVNDSLDHNVLGVNYNGSVVENFYHPYSAVFSDDVKRLSLKKVKGNKYLYLFIKMMILQQKDKYMYAYKFNAKRMNRQKIMLPVDSVGEPDWEYIESLGKSIYKKKKQSVVGCMKKKYDQLTEEIESFVDVEIQDVEWLPIKVKEVFSVVQRGKRLTKANQIEGSIPYISSKSLNNGIDNFIGNDEGIRMSGYDITIANSGSVGYTFYHDYNYIASDHVHSLSNEKFNRYHYLFLVTMMNRLQEKYHFNREINQNRLDKEKIMLPVDDEGDINLDFMELYMKKIEYEKLKKIVDYLQKKLERGRT